MEKTITNLEIQKRDPNRINVYLDNEFAFGISRFVGMDLRKGSSIGEHDISSLINQDQREKAFQRALRFISYHPRTAAEVREKLTVLGFEEKIIDVVLNELFEKKYVDDREFAENWVLSRSQSKPRSQRMLEFEMKRKGISESDIQAALESAPPDKEMAIQLGKKYLNRFARLNEVDFTKKMSGVLSRRAFPYSIVKEAIIELLKFHNE